VIAYGTRTLYIAAPLRGQGEDKDKWRADIRGGVCEAFLRGLGAIGGESKGAFGVFRGVQISQAKPRSRRSLTGQTLTEHTPVFPIYFRLLTLLAFHTFLSLGVDATVLEVGIGGLYDSTNIVPKPVVTGVTSLGLDHTAVLGNTIEEIARNKAGIYKSGVPALSVVQEQVSGGEVLRSVAEKVGAPFEVVPSIPETPLGLKGAHQRINASLAVALAKGFLKSRGERYDEVLPDSFRGPLERTRWPGRCQKVEQGETTWLLDGAHTTESLRSCGEWAWTEAAPNVLIFNCSGGRAAESLLGSLLDAGAGASGVSREQLGKNFDTVVFCTNVTYTDGHFKGGERIQEVPVPR
jgi:folylpolyglutamate synthase